jgi:hypothetical protein
LQRLNVSASAKTALATILNAVNEPEGEGLAFALKHLEPERRALVDETAKVFRSISRGVARRGKKSLQEMSEDEWNELVRKANDERET